MKKERKKERKKEKKRKKEILAHSNGTVSWY